jgi:glutamate synthase (NADPH/NADH) large chain
MIRPTRGGLYDPQTEHDACGIGFVAHIKGEKSRDIVDQGLEVLSRMSHRAACGCDPESGDGAGILLQLPHDFLKREAKRLGFGELRRRRYGIGQMFLPPDRRRRAACEEIVESVVAEQGQEVIGWRDVPIDSSHVGPLAREVMPVIRQVYIRLRRLPPSAFERKLYVIRKLAGKRVREGGHDPDGQFHVMSMSSETIVYKGLLLPGRLSLFYKDLQESDLVSAIALVHSRFSTNTFPTWDLAQPFRYICHNGEINTLRGNRNWMMARRSQLQSAKFGGDLNRLFPIIVPGKSDSAQFDNMLELLYLGGRSLPHSIMMMIPEAWQGYGEMPQERKDFYEYLQSLMEPWDGPAAIAFTDGEVIGATLDRNGLRPARYLVTDDDRIILASETGVLDIPPENVCAKGRLRPGKLLLVDTAEGRILDDDEVKRDLAGRWPFGAWLKRNVFEFHHLPDVSPPPRTPSSDLPRLQRAFGYTDEHLRILVEPMARTGKEPVGAMGCDTPLAVLSNRAPNLFEYFHQLFAQVTNPAIDPIRERLVMTVSTKIGPDGNTFDETPEQCHRLRLDGPILTNRGLAKIAATREGAFEATTLSLLFDATAGPEELGRAVRRLCNSVVEAIDDGYNILVLSDRGVDARRAAIPSLLAVSAVHQHLVREGIRMQAGLVIETGEAREVHDFAVLIGYGAAAINPYIAFDSINEMVEQGTLDGNVEEAEKRYIAAIEGGLLKIMSKMGISTLQSYRGAQIFESGRPEPRAGRRALHRHRFATRGRACSSSGARSLERHDRGLRTASARSSTVLPTRAVYQWRRRGERHVEPEPRSPPYSAPTASDNEARYREYSASVDDETADTTLRGLLEFDRRCVAGDPPRRGRVGARSSSASSPARCPSARSAPRLTRPSRSR